MRRRHVPPFHDKRLDHLSNTLENPVLLQGMAISSVPAHGLMNERPASVATDAARRLFAERSPRQELGATLLVGSRNAEPRHPSLGDCRWSRLRGHPRPPESTPGGGIQVSAKRT